MSVKRTLLLIACGWLLSTSCMVMNAGDGDGSGTRTGNPSSITGMVLDSLGTPYSDVRVTVRRPGYVSGISRTSASLPLPGGDAFTDETGRFTVDSLDTGVYMVEMNDNRSCARLEKCVIPNHADTVSLGRDTIRRYATIAGNIGIATGGRQRYVQIYGLERLVPVAADGSFSVADLPAGDFTLRIVESDTSIAPVIIDGIAVGAGGRIEIPYGAWTWSAKVILNTSWTGAAVQSAITGFPVLLRLTAANFPFAQAKAGGSDVRFARADGSPLACEVEQWDSAGKSASLWVKTDTIYGNNGSQFITMYWGNTAALSISNGPAVFDTTGGFKGVWHLGETGGNNPGTYHDATVCGNHGQGSGMEAVPQVEGVIGKAQYFNGTSSCIVIPPAHTLNFANSNATLSVWLKSTMTIGHAALLFEHDVWWQVPDSIGVPGSYQLTFWDKTSAGLNFIASNGLFNWIGANWILCDGQWHYMAATFDDSNNTARVYIDGTERATYPGIIESIGSSDAASYIGARKADTLFFNGTLDEMRVCSRAVSADWIKLCYENQKINQTLVRVDSLKFAIVNSTVR